MGAPFAADLHASHCYAILPGGQVRLSEQVYTRVMEYTIYPSMHSWQCLTSMH